MLPLKLGHRKAQCVSSASLGISDRGNRLPSSRSLSLFALNVRMRGLRTARPKAEPRLSCERINIEHMFTLSIPSPFCQRPSERERERAGKLLRLGPSIRGHLELNPLLLD